MNQLDRGRDGLEPVSEGLDHVATLHGPVGDTDQDQRLQRAESLEVF